MAKKEELTEEQKIEKELHTLSRELHKANNPKFVFFRGILTGLATAIGATVVAAAVIAIVSQIMRFIGLGDLFH
jgi:hypothetical protein